MPSDSSPSIRASRDPERCVKQRRGPRGRRDGEGNREACVRSAGRPRDCPASICRPQASRFPCSDLRDFPPQICKLRLAIALPRSAGLRPRDFPAPFHEAGREIPRPEASRFPCPVLQAQAPDSSELSGSHRARPDWRPLESNLVVSSPAASFVPLVSCPNK